MKVMIIALVAIAVTAALVLFYGALRPAGEADVVRRGVDGGFGWLTVRPTLDFDDVADAPCADPALPGFTVDAAGCRIPLPDPAQITLCAPEPAAVVVTTRGTEYPAQRVTASALTCAEPAPVPVYDSDTVLSITCVLVAPCIVRVVPARG
ncbi:hypothetical protein [Microbacterium jiangjiandongii]|uniref:hypothetical protein n=1 Tax=Microbacterium jiangjiandongii TaxID=3049071 RepID=UPI00214CE8A1|nr:hypothetical protein [Microbacterium sp. zg.Y843]MCR2815095.1 hypothetical protein [Microbacterium sp. zg.Y843]